MSSSNYSSADDFEVSDMLTRFGSITICSITTGVIWISRPESLLDVILYDNTRVRGWVDCILHCGVTELNNSIRVLRIA